MSYTAFPDQLSRRSLFGAQAHEHGVTFSLFSRSATQVWLMVFTQPDDMNPRHEVKMHRFGDVWHYDCPDTEPGMCYCFRVERKENNDPEQWLLDPFARAIYWSTPWGVPTIEAPGIIPKFGTAFPKSVIAESRFDWSNDQRPQIAWEDMVMYETHLRGFTRHDSSGVSAPGTYSGFIEKLPYLKSLGITSIELLPIYEFNEREYHYLKGDARAELCNYWGYSTVGFFAPNGRYAASGRAGQQIDEFKSLVKAIHDQGMEVILDVVFNHTAENGPNDMTYSFRGIDEHIYYSVTEQGHYRNFSGCGNTVNCNNLTVTDFIINALRYWVAEYHIDGFRFDLASIFCRGEYGRLLKQPPIVEKIDADPLLRDVKMIAEAWDCSTYLVGDWPSSDWAEWNGRYRDDIRQFWKGETDQLSKFATRLTGSDDLYRKDQWMQKSVNFVTCHDGMTLRDLVSYDHKHNEDNLEGNRDGSNDNHSHNYGIEGHTDDPEVNTLRMQQQKNFMLTLLLSQGIPMLLGGDEFSRTQNGNNNAYCQDSPLSWFDWELAHAQSELFDFTREAIALRKRFNCLRRTKFFEGGDPAIKWHGIKGAEVAWGKDKSLACWLSGTAEHTGAEADQDDLFMAFNPDVHAVYFKLPDAETTDWKLILASTEIKNHGTLIELPPYSSAVLSGTASKPS